jgi:hypothetical protein
MKIWLEKCIMDQECPVSCEREFSSLQGKVSITLHPSSAVFLLCKREKMSFSWAIHDWAIVTDRQQNCRKKCFIRLHCYVFIVVQTKYSRPKPSWTKILYLDKTLSGQNALRQNALKQDIKYFCNEVSYTIGAARKYRNPISIECQKYWITNDASLSTMANHFLLEVGVMSPDFFKLPVSKKVTIV